MVIFIIVIVFVLLIIVIISSYLENKEKQEHDEGMRKNLEAVKGFVSTFEIKGPLDWFIVKFDENNEKVAYISQEIARVFSFNDIVSVELIENGITTYKKSVSGTIGGAIIGGALAGGAGMIVGGLSSSSKGSQTITSRIVKIIINDISNPTIEMDCLNEYMKNYKGGIPSKQIAGKIVDTFKVIINRNTKTSDNQ